MVNQFGDVLRGLGSALNPQVMQGVQAEDQARIAQQQQMQMLMLGQVIKGVESGAIDSSKLPPQFQGIVGPTPQVKREIDLRKAMENLTPEQRQQPGVLKNLFLQYGDPKEALAYYAKENSLTDLPEIVKLQAAERQYRTSGQTALADQVAQRIAKLNSQENSQTQEMMAHILKVKQMTEAGQTVSNEDKQKASLFFNFLNTPRTDPSGAVINPSLGNQFDPSTGFGKQPAPAPAGIPGGPQPTVLPGGRGFVIPGQVKPGDTEMKVLSESDALKGHLEDLDKRYKPDWVGPLSGRFGALQAGTVGASPERAEFMAQAALYKNRLIKFITGAQMGEAETVRLIKEIPDVNDPPTTFEAKRKISETNIDYVTKAYQQNMRQAGVRQIGGNPVSGPKEGEKSTSKSGKPIHFDGQRWVYD